MKENDLVMEIAWICRAFSACCVEVERRKELSALKEKLETLMMKGRAEMNITEPGLLVALLDGYEVTRDEEMLQTVLNMVSSQIAELKPSVDAVKLLAYCYHYVEEETCLVRAQEMLEVLRERGEEVREAEQWFP